MADVCPKCLMQFPHHLVVRARCAKRWRGGNFDQAAAEGNVGAALATHWSIDVRTQAGLEALLRRALIRGYGERRDVNPTHAYDSAEGEDFEFHVGLRETLPADEVETLRRIIVAAIGNSRNFTVM